jgi:hypothetical protein
MAARTILGRIFSGDAPQERAVAAFRNNSAPFVRSIIPTVST